MELSKPAERLIALLENARELAIRHQQRTVASDVVLGCRVYANSIRLGLSDDYFLDLAESIKGKNSNVLNEHFDFLEAKIFQIAKLPSE